MTAQNYDVFISYSSKDKEWVRGELLQRIEQAGLRAFIDFRDFTTGAPSIKEMERGVVECRKTLLVLTPDYIGSEWCDIENIMAQTLSPANRDLRMIPLLKTRCDKPLRIAALTHIDFTDGADFDLAWRQLLIALGASPDPVQPETPSREQWYLAHPYAMPPNFTGRIAERNMLTDWLTRDDAHPLLVLRALGGFGKSALTWHWLLNDIDPAEYPRVVWWSFYEGDASFETFIAETLRYLNSSSAPSASPREQFGSLLKALHSHGTILILDGFERALRAFGGLNAAYQGDDSLGSAGGERDCISPLADAFLRNMASLPGMHGKVLITSRLRPAKVETRGGILLQGCREEELVQLHPADAVAFFHAQGIRGGRVEIETACEPYGYHPLSLRLLAGLIVGDPQQPGDIAAAPRLDVSGDLVQRQHHVLEQSYTSLGPPRQKLLSRIACFRSPVSYEALLALAETEFSDSNAATDVYAEGRNRSDEDSLDRDLRELIGRGLLHRDLGTNRFDLHPIVRRYAYDRLAARDRAGAHARLRDYFAAVPEPTKVRSVEDLAPVIELYHHTVRAGQYDEACDLFYARISEATFFQLGAYSLRIELLRGLFPNGEDTPPQLKKESDQTWTQIALANSYVLIGQPRRAVPLTEAANKIDEKRDAKNSLVIGLVNLASTQLQIGFLRAADANLRRSVDLTQQIRTDIAEGVGDLTEADAEFMEGVARQEWGLLLALRGAWTESRSELAKALDIFERRNSPQSERIVWLYRALQELLEIRCTTVTVKSELENLMAPIGTARRALNQADEMARADYIRAHWLLGKAQRTASQLTGAERDLHEALECCRRINLVEVEADILIDLALLRIATAAPDEANRLAEEALAITERCGYVLQGADAHLVLAQLAKDRGDVKELRHHATEALRLATCDGPPDYTYKAAYDEATALLR